jgi:anionic cell wall polymer biosynthesis LytR-Cps2A-Psr (LCP) family protein
VEYLLEGVNVDHYFALTMDAVASGCDLVGGVEVTVLDDFTGVDDTLVQGETVTLNGTQALHYVRSRYGLEDGTNSSRMKRQQQYIEAWRKKVISQLKADESFALKLVDTMDDYVVYDSSDHKMQKFVEKFNEYEFLGIRELEGKSEIGEEFAEFYPDEAALRKLVIELFYTPKSRGVK